MALPLAEAFTARSLGVMWDNYKKTLGTAPYLGRQKFGTRKQDSLDLRFIKGKNGLPVSLKASNFDAQAELRDVGGFSDIQNSMPFYREGYMVTEKEEQEYDNYRTSENSSLANNVLREISKKPMMLIEGALVVPERQIWQLLAPTDGVPKVKVVLGDKNYVVDYTADNGAEHKEKHFKSITGTSAWDKPTTCAPLDDLITARRDFAKATGYSLTRFTMNTETWEMVLKAEDTKKQVLGITAYNGGIRLQQGQVTEYLRGYGIEIILVNAITQKVGMTLPCKDVYFIVDINNPKYAMVMKRPIRELAIYGIEDIDKEGCKYFSTKEKAEAKLKELRGGEDG